MVRSLVTAFSSHSSERREAGIQSARSADALTAKRSYDVIKRRRPYSEAVLQSV